WAQGSAQMPVPPLPMLPTGGSAPGAISKRFDCAASRLWSWPIWSRSSVTWARSCSTSLRSPDFRAAAGSAASAVQSRAAARRRRERRSEARMTGTSRVGSILSHRRRSVPSRTMGTLRAPAPRSPGSARLRGDARDDTAEDAALGEVAQRRGDLLEGDDAAYGRAKAACVDELEDVVVRGLLDLGQALAVARAHAAADERPVLEVELVRLHREESAGVGPHARGGPLAQETARAA